MLARMSFGVVFLVFLAMYLVSPAYSQTTPPATNNSGGNTVGAVFTPFSDSTEMAWSGSPWLTAMGTVGGNNDTFTVSAGSVFSHGNNETIWSFPISIFYMDNGGTSTTGGSNSSTTFLAGVGYGKFMGHPYNRLEGGNFLNLNGTAIFFDAGGGGGNSTNFLVDATYQHISPVVNARDWYAGLGPSAYFASGGGSNTAIGGKAFFGMRFYQSNNSALNLQLQAQTFDFDTMSDTGLVLQAMLMYQFGGGKNATNIIAAEENKP